VIAAMRRVQLVGYLIALLAPHVRVTNLGNGWPTLVEAQTSLGAVPVALYVAQVILSGSGRNSDKTERRVENPGPKRPIIVPPSSLPIVIGLWHSDAKVPVPRPVLMAANAWKREGRMTRHSVFVQLESLIAASTNGWDSRQNSHGEEIVCLLPSQFVELVENLVVDAIVHPIGVLNGSEIALVELAKETPERARRVATTLVRAAGFGSNVVAAYNERCAVCDLDLKLVQGAHIYPVEAANSHDEIRNGLCLCANHHVAFDRHRIHIDPQSRRITLHPWLTQQAQGDPVASLFLKHTREFLRPPQDMSHRPPDQVFVQRYAHFGESYGWATPKTR
jgi:hypothetical protein